MRTEMHPFVVLTGVVAVAALAVATPGMANSPQQKADKLVCKGQAKTGTRFRTRICRTRAEWDQIAEENKRLMQEMAGRTIKACGPMTGCD